MADSEPFFERFRRLLEEHSLRPEAAATIMGTSVDVVRRLSDGRTKQAKLDEALRLCDRLGIDPWYLAFGRERPASQAISGVSPLLSDLSERRIQSRLGGLAPGDRDALRQLIAEESHLIASRFVEAYKVELEQMEDRLSRFLENEAAISRAAERARADEVPKPRTRGKS